MADRKFAHLHLHTHYSMLDGFNRIPELVKQTKKLGMTALAITDHGNLYGAVEFYTECKKAGINPILGYEAYLAPGSRRDKKAARQGDAYSHLTLLAKNSAGFKNLIKLASIAFLEGYYYHPRIDREVLEAHSEGLICLSGCLAGEFNQYILNEKLNEAEKVAEYFARLFKTDFYIEIQNNGIAAQDLCTPVAAEISDKLGVPLVATADAHYLCADDAEAHDVLFCISTQQKRDPKKKRYPEERMPNPYYVRSPSDMYKLFPEFEDAVARSQEIADGVNVELDFGKRCFPTFIIPKKKTPEQYLRELCEQGLRERYGLDLGGTGFQPVRAEEHRLEAGATQESIDPKKAAFAEAVKARLEHELGIIERMGFSSYFLVVWDFVRFAREKGIPCTARGSGCGAIVAYTLYLSHVCPIEYDLLFERFLDPNRKEAPDIDIDFCQDRRGEVIQYVKEKYGAESVAQIGTFGTLAAKAALKDVGRVLDVPLERVNFLCKLVPMHGAIAGSLDEAMKAPDFRKEYDQDPQVKQLVDIAIKLEGCNRNVGTHAAGVVIADGPITDFVPVQRPPKKNDDAAGGPDTDTVTTQWEMGVLEKVGMLKMDFLGLRNLTVLDKCVKLIKKTRDEDIDPAKFDLEDKKTYELLQSGNVKGVFQLESEGIRDLLKRMKPDSIRDLIAVLALYRPGPLSGGMVDSYVNRKHRRETWDYPHPVLKDILDETYGVMCIHEDARVAMADGTEKVIKNVVRGERVQAVNLESGAIEAKDCFGCGPTVHEAGMRLILENGFSVVLTADHPVRTYNGWKEVLQLDAAADLVACAVHAPQERPTSAELAPWLGKDTDVAYLLGFLTGDGCLTGSGITIATGTEANHRKFAAWVADRFPSLHRHEYHHTRSWYVTLSHSELLNDPEHGNRKTRLHDWLDTHGMKCKANVKRVPEAIFRGDAAVRAAYLAGIVDSDGCLAVSNRGIAVAFITSASHGLRQDLRRLLTLEGIPLKLYSQRVQVWGVAKLRQVIEPFLVLKQFSANCPTGNTVGWVPRDEVFAAVPIGESMRAFASRTSIERSGLRHQFPFVKSSTAAKAGVRTGDVRYFRIAAIEPVPEAQFYGISVADHHNLIADGVVVKNCYQEQIMRILNRLGGIELSKAYGCIKAISKKVEEKIQATRADFIAGCQSQGVSEAIATDIFEKIVFFAGYGFNKSHTAAYAQIGYQTAYLKAHYTAEYMAALLSSEIDDGGKRDIMVDHIADTRKLGVDVLPPDINRGMADFDVVNNRILFGLTAIKGLGRGAANEIVRARTETGAFKDLFDFAERIDRRIVQKSAVERLVMAGAFDAFGKRAALFAAVSKAFQSADERASDLRRGQKSIFDMFADDAEANGKGHAGGSDHGLPDVPEWPDTEKLKFEKEALDFYMSSHPLAQHEDQLKRFRTHDAAQAVKLAHGSPVLLAGMVAGLQMRTVQKNGKRWAMFQLEDFTGQCKCILWSDEYLRFKDQVVDDSVFLFEGAVEWRDGGTAGDVIVRKVLTIDDAKKEMTRSLLLRMPYADDDEGLRKLESVGAVLKRNRGQTPVFLSVRDPQGKQVKLKLSDSYAVNAANLRAEDLEMILGPGSVVFTR